MQPSGHRPAAHLHQARADRRWPPGSCDDLAAALAAPGLPAFACIPGARPGLMAAASERCDIAAWAAARSRS